MAVEINYTFAILGVILFASIFVLMLLDYEEPFLFSLMLLVSFILFVLGYFVQKRTNKVVITARSEHGS